MSKDRINALLKRIIQHEREAATPLAQMKWVRHWLHLKELAEKV